MKVLLVLALMLVAVAAQSKWAYCAYEHNDRFEVEDVTLEPLLPTPGTTTKVILRGRMHGCVNAGNWTVTLWEKGIYEKHPQHAKSALSDSMKLPLCEGTTALVRELDIPVDAKPERYSVRTRITDQNGEPVVSCLETFMDVENPAEQ